MSAKYILEGHKPVICHDLMEWAEWIEAGGHRVVAKTIVKPGVDVSTVFLGLDHNHSKYGPPILFETMVFGGEHDQDMNRYSTWEEAEAGHKRMVEMVKGG